MADGSGDEEGKAHSRGKARAAGRMGYVALGCLLVMAGIVLVPAPVAFPFFGVMPYVFATLVLATLVGAVWSLFQAGGSRVAGVTTLILAVLIVLGSPRNADRTGRARAARGLELTSAAKTAIAAYYAAHARFPASNAEAGLANPGDAGGEATGDIAVSDGGTITVTYRGTPIDGKTIVLSPRLRDGQIDWDCAGGTLHAAYRPAHCR